MAIFVTFTISPTSNRNAVLSYAFGTLACFTLAYAGSFLCNQNNEVSFENYHRNISLQDLEDIIIKHDHDSLPVYLKVYFALFRWLRLHFARDYQKLQMFCAVAHLYL